MHGDCTLEVWPKHGSNQGLPRLDCCGLPFWPASVLVLSWVLPNMHTNRIRFSWHLAQLHRLLRRYCPVPGILHKPSPSWQSSSHPCGGRASPGSKSRVRKGFPAPTYGIPESVLKKRGIISLESLKKKRLLCSVVVFSFGAIPSNCFCSSPAVCLGPPPSQLIRSHSFAHVVVLGPPPSQVLRSHSSDVFCCFFSFSLVVVLGPPPRQILRSHSSTCSMLLFFSLVIVWAHLNAVVVLCPSPSQVIRSRSSARPMLLFFSQVAILGPPRSTIFRSHSYVVPYVQCCFLYFGVVLGPPPSQILRSHKYTVPRVQCFFSCPVFWVHFQVNVSDGRNAQSRVQLLFVCVLLLFWATSHSNS